MAIGPVPFALQNASHSASVFRIAQSAPFTSGGILAANELPVSQQGTPNMSVILGPGRAQIVGTSVSAPSGQVWTTQAQYNAYNDANLTLTVTASNPTNPRIDAVYVQAQDAFYTGSTNTAVAGVVAGTPAVSPVAPSVPVNSILIAYIAVAANVTTIVTANISYQAVVAGLIQSATVPPFVSLGMTAAQNAPLSSFAAVTWDLVRSDVLGLHSTSVNPSRITVQKAGRYRVTAHARTNGITATSYLGLEFAVNGTALDYTGTIHTGNTVNFTSILISANIQMNVGDYVEVWSISAAANAFTVTASMFQLEYVAAS